MVTRAPKNQNSVNLFLNNYFNMIMSLVVILVLFVSYLVIIKPKYDATMLAIQTNIDQEQRLYLEQSKKLNNLKTVSDLYKKISPEDLKKFNGVLPDNYVKERLFGELEEIISTNGFVLNSVVITKPEEDVPADSTVPAADATQPAPSTHIGTLTLQLNISAVDYSGFKNLLKLLENNLRLFDVTAVSFSPGGNSAQITLATYYYKK